MSNISNFVMLILRAVVPPTVNYQPRLLHTSARVQDAPEVPSFQSYETSSPSGNRALSYFMVGSLGVLSASIAKSSVTEFLGTMSASADVLALAKVEVELANIPEGKNVIIKWRGKPVFIRHRTQAEIEEARSGEWKGFRDPESDEARTKKPEWLVMLGICTHLGCVPIGEAGDYGGWCVVVFFRDVMCSDMRLLQVLPLSRIPLRHLSVTLYLRYSDITLTLPTAGRVRKGPAPVRTSIFISLVSF